MITISLPANKHESLPLLYRKALNFIELHAERKRVIKNDIIPFPEIYHTLSCMFHLEKDDSIEVFEELRGAGLVEVVPYRGIRLIKNSKLSEGIKWK